MSSYGHTGGQKPGFSRNFFVAVQRSGKNPVSLGLMYPGMMRNLADEAPNF